MKNKKYFLNKRTSAKEINFAVSSAATAGGNGDLRAEFQPEPKNADSETAKQLAVIAKRKARLERVIFVWTIISTLYTIAATCWLIGSGWVERPTAYVLASILCIYILLFVIILVLSKKNPDRSRKSLSYYRKFLKLFRTCANITFLILSAISMAGMAHEGLQSIQQWFLFTLTFAVAVFQLALKIALLILTFSRKRLGKRFSVEVSSFVNGKRKKTLAHKISEKTYKND